MEEKDNVVDMNELWKTATSLLNDDTVMDELSSLKQLETLLSFFNKGGNSKQSSKNILNKLETLSSQLGKIEGQLGKLNQSIEELINSVEPTRYDKHQGWKKESNSQNEDNS